MIFSQVENLTVPQGVVNKIIYNNTVLWERKKLFRYIKLVMNEITDSSVKTIVQFSEVKFLNEEGQFFTFPENTVVTATISASTGNATNPTPEVPQNLIDNNVETKFCSQEWVPNSYVLFDLGENNWIDVLKYNQWQWYTANDTASFPERNLKTFTLYGSKDNVNWKLLDSQENYVAPAENYTLAYTGNINGQA